MKIIWNRINRRPPERRKVKNIGAGKDECEVDGTTIDSNLDIIKNKLYDVRTSLYTDYTEYSDDPAKGGFY
jgi:hypothetical protein